MSDRERELEACLEDIVSLAIIPSAITIHFSQICDIQKTAKSCLNNNPDYTKVIEELKELKLNNGLLEIELNNKSRLLASCEQALKERDGL